MGTVYLAVRANDQYQKKVAIKVVNRGMDTEMILVASRWSDKSGQPRTSEHRTSARRRLDV
jgi:hypothetical protein